MKNLFVFLIFSLSLFSCSKQSVCDKTVHESANGVYYWKTVFQLDESDRDFIRKHNIGRLYLRFFDVTPQFYEENWKNGEWNKTPKNPVPNATIRFDEDSIGVESVVPTVYITIDALKAMDDVSRYAKLLVERVNNMCSYHGIKNVDEFQLDCDWTASTDSIYFALCKEVKYLIHDKKLSATIRLHQLTMDAPPVDYGVLMVYNTGSFLNPNGRNSILDYDDVKPFIDKQINYSLPLDFAYPTYSWFLAYDKNDKFKGLIRDVTKFTDHNWFYNDTLRIYDQPVEFYNKTLVDGDYIVRESSEFANIERVKHLVETKLGYGRDYSVILYHLDSDNLSKYTDDEISTLYSRVN